MYRHNQRWTREEINLVRTYFNRYPTSDIAALMGRSVGSILNEAMVLGLITRDECIEARRQLMSPLE